jgi:antitoxin CptB
MQAQQSAAIAIEDPARIRRLSWRARRGLLENDLILQRFLHQHGAVLDEEAVQGLDRLLDLTDNQLLDLLLARTELETDLDTPSVRRVLEMLRRC